MMNSRATDWDMMINHLVSPKSGPELMQNCDLPPPMKVFTASEKVIPSPINRICKDEKLELLKALRLSQTRAREAEKKAASLSKEKDLISNAMLKESLRLFAYRQWVRLLEIQVSGRHWQGKNEGKQFCCCDEWEKREGDDHSGMPWLVALAICLGIAGVGFSFGCR